MAMTPLPTPPLRSDPANFAARGDAFMAALPTFVTEANALQVDVTTKQGIASTAATTATTQAGISTAQAVISTDQAVISTTQAGISTTQAGIATTQAGLATTKADEAAASAVASSVNAPLLLTGVAGADTVTANVTPTLTGYATGQLFKFIAVADNTGAVTANIDGQGASPVTKNGTEALSPGDIKTGQAYLLLRDAAGNFQLSGGSGGGAAAGGVFYLCNNTLLEDYEIPADTGAIKGGDLYFAPGADLTFGANSTLSLV